ncbi:DUF4188 domain-containing protein [Rhodococcus sp. WS4]|nr:DUF4188 domain-containing protein [Rhodococcus sp. WS4]
MEIKAGRYEADYPDEFIVFFIGMRINQLWRINEWWPILRAAFAMVKEAKALPNSPLLKSDAVVTVSDWRMPLFIQYWRSFDELVSWANNNDLRHRPAQKEFFRRTAYNGHVGVFHETFRVAAGQYETLYANMPRMGLAAVGEYVPLSGKSRARDRMGKRHPANESTGSSTE